MKHEHKKTKKLKVALFSMIMFLPFIAIGVTCATHIFNKEVTEETETATINYMYETNNPQEEIIQNNVYNINFNGTPLELSGQLEDNIIEITLLKGEIKYTNASLIPDENVPNDDNIIKPSKTKLNNYQGTTTIYQYFNSGYSSAILETENNTTIEIKGQIQINTWYYTDTTSTLQSSLTQATDIQIESVDITTNPQDQTTNIFYDSCAQVEQSFILNWCEQANPVRNPIQSFTNAFSLPSNHIINTLITYWICIAMIYIVIDIIVECIVMLTHFFNKEF